MTDQLRKLRKELVDWITLYKNAAERNALAEDPDESADYLISLIQSRYINLNKLQAEMYEWTKYNFPEALPYQPILGLIEELGELAHAHLKQEQKIRMNEDHEAQKKDAIGDIVIFLIDYCNRNGFNLENCIIETWKEVQKRDCQKDRQQS